MRVAVHADPALHTIPGGIGTYVRRLVDQLLATAGEDHYRLIISRTAEPPPAWTSVEMIRPALPVGQLYAAWNFTGRPKLKDEVDVVHATSLAIPPLKGALVATIHDLAVERMPEVVPAIWRKVYLKGLNVALNNSKILIAVSQATKDALIEAHQIEPDRIVVTPQGPNVTAESRRDDSVLGRLGITEPYILCVGTVEPRKNHKRLIRAFVEAGTALRGWTLVIAGAPGWGQEEAQSEIEARRVAHRVVLTGKVSTAGLVSLYSKAGVFAFPSLYEGFGLPLLEALGFGIPSLASTTPALVELAGPAALTVDPLDTGEIADALIRLSADQELRATLSEAGSARAGQFSWEATAEATRAAYLKAAGA